MFFLPVSPHSRAPQYSFSYALLGIVSTLVIGGGCAEDLTPTGGDSPPSSSSTTPEIPLSTEMDPEDSGPWLITIDATHEENWARFDLDTGSLTDGEDWDLAFQSTKIQSNSGISGSGGVVVCPIQDGNFETLTESPEEDCYVDREDGDDEDTKPDYAFLNPISWYSYDPVNHVISTQPVVYVVTSTEGLEYKLELLNYYDEAGNPRWVTFQWALVEAEIAPTEPEVSEEDTPEEESEDGFLLPADTPGDWVYLTLGESPTVVEPEDGSWDLAVQGVQFQSNSGTSGDGFGGVQATDSQWDELESISTVGFAVDTLVPIPGPPGSGEFSGNPILNEWFAYDMETHTATPRDVVYAVRLSSGAYAKFQILSYGPEGMRIQSAPISGDVIEYETALEITSPETFLYMDFEMGNVGKPGEMLENWDIGLSDSVLQTHSGTSGEGLGGALEMSDTPFDALQSATAPGCYSGPPDHQCDCEQDSLSCEESNGIWTEQCTCDLTFTTDEWLTLGEEEWSGNAELSGWDNPDMLPLGYIFLLKTAEGNYVKLQFTGFNAGVLTLKWAFSGAGRNTF